MKKIFLSSLLVTLLVLLTAFTINSLWHTSCTDTLVNEKYGQTLTLYANGYAAVETSDGSGAGRYDINYSDEITINWENGATSIGFVTSKNTTSGKRIHSAVIGGVTYTNPERFVLKRPRRR